MTQKELLNTLSDAKGVLNRQFGISKFALFDSMKTFIKNRIQKDLGYV